MLVPNLKGWRGYNVGFLKSLFLVNAVSDFSITNCVSYSIFILNPIPVHICLKILICTRGIGKNVEASNYKLKVVSGGRVVYC